MKISSFAICTIIKESKEFLTKKIESGVSVDEARIIIAKINERNDIMKFIGDEEWPDKGVFPKAYMVSLSNNKAIAPEEPKKSEPVNIDSGGPIPDRKYYLASEMSKAGIDAGNPQLEYDSESIVISVNDIGVMHERFGDLEPGIYAIFNCTDDCKAAPVNHDFFVKVDEKAFFDGDGSTAKTIAKSTLRRHIAGGVSIKRVCFYSVTSGSKPADGCSRPHSAPKKP